MSRRKEQRLLAILQGTILMIVVIILPYFLIVHKKDSTASRSDNMAQEREEEHLKEPDQADSIPFDPNTADSLTLIRVGLTPYQAKNLIRYRQKGGEYHCPEDMKKLYGLTVGQWEHLAPLIRIGKKYQYLSDNEDVYARHYERRYVPTREREEYYHENRQGQDTFRRYSTEGRPYSDSILRNRTDNIPQDKVNNTSQKTVESSLPQRTPPASVPSHSPESYSPFRSYRKVPKLHPGQHIDLNKADTIALQSIPGIGSYYAKRIDEYRKKLGGFVSLNQLNDPALDFLPMGIEEYLTLQPDSIQKLNINHLSVRELNQHPYLTYPQARQIHEYVRLHGPLKSWDDLLFLSEFSESDKERLEPYVSFR